MVVSRSHTSALAITHKYHSEKEDCAALMSVMLSGARLVLARGVETSMLSSVPPRGVGERKLCEGENGGLGNSLW